MNKVKFEAETGAELRKQMLDFLGLNELTSKIGGGDLSIVLERPKTILEDVNTIREAANIPPLDLTPQPTDEKTTRKRRSKAEIEAEKAAENQSGDTPTDVASEDVVDPNLAATQSEQTTDDTPTETVKSEITRPFLTEIVLAKGREGKKPAMLTLFATYKQLDSDLPVTGLPTLNPADYEDFYSKVKDL